ncbi:transposase [Oleiharenicola lentus]|uniref:Transposase n=1 Tax=Oleiharenicola lentus TaxID=2508720 RepID=A0A4Q1CA16_9BACT|nr:transposase [Oleiharenicola lentus]RXK55844.1 transposase [Oleiharenicola lentus]
MARKLRLEFPGAIYHVINRGNYRAFVFKTEGARQAFEACVLEACARYGWLLHAYVIMGNHYHLAVETPQGNLVAGMQWLQSTFANRFNRLRGERGHLFQGRYKALMVEEGEGLGLLCHYIHLNPVRAGLTTLAKLHDYRSSSYWHLTRPKQRPECLQCQTALSEAGQLADTPAGWRAYADYLAWQLAEGPAGKSKAYVSMSRGWALGGKEFKQALLQDQAVAAESRAWESHGVQEVREARWQAALDTLLKALPPAERTNTRKSAPWKVKVAWRLKETTDVTNGWLAERLDMGSGFYVSKHVGLAKNKVKGKA